MKVVAGSRIERAAATRALLVAAARKLFAERGYHATGTPDVVALAGVTRGALYHHFADKEALFEAVFRELEQELYELSAAAVLDAGYDRLAQMQFGIRAFLRIVAERRDIQRVVLIDGPAVLGWSRWRELGAEFTLGALVMSFEDMAAHGQLAPNLVRSMAHLISASLNEASLLIANSDEPDATRIEVDEALQMLIRNFG